MDAVLGHERILDVFDRLLSGGRLAHAYLFVGPDGVGKTMLMRTIAARILDTAPDRLLSHPNVVWVSRPVDEKTGALKTVLSVGVIRDLCETLALSVFGDGYRVAIIEDAAHMNLEAANALLKMLEEPSRRTILFLRAACTDDLPATVVSRTQVIRCLPVASKDIVVALVKRGADPSEAEELAQLSLGRPGVAFRLFAERDRFKKWRDHREMFVRAAEAPLHERLAMAGHLVPKTTLDGHAEGEMIFGVWEQVLRDRLLADVSSGSSLHAVEALDALAESRRALARHTSLQLAFEHTLLHL